MTSSFSVQTVYTVVVVILLSLLVLLVNRTHFDRQTPLPMKSFDPKGRNEKNENANAVDENFNWNKNQLERIKWFREKCKMYGLTVNDRSNIESIKKILYSEKYKLALRAIPKVGSTFMKQVIYILSDIQTEQVFDMARDDVHKVKKYGINKRITIEDLDSYTYLIITRNPYSRLYSAYIDKFYMVNSQATCTYNISKLNTSSNRTPKCNCKVTFKDFLDYILYSDKRIASNHYDPVMSISYARQLCNLKNIHIIKQETFSEDIDHVMKSLMIKGKVYDIIYDEMHSKNAISTIKSIVKTLYPRLSLQIRKKPCMSWKEITKRLWKSFQIQGYIHIRSKLPAIKIDKQLSCENLLELIMTELEKRPLKHEEKISQRKDALSNAYAGVDEKVLHEIRKRYTLDFDMFQYKTDPLL